MLRKHWPALNQAGLVVPTPPQVWRAKEKRNGRQYFVETFQWKSLRASYIAHHAPAVMAIWEPMMPLLESMQLAQIVPLSSPKTPLRPRSAR